MTVVYLKKVPGGLIPASEQDAEVIKKFRIGSVIKADCTNPRNIKFHRKYFCLVNLAYELWCETRPVDQEYKGIPVLPDFDRFREDLVILCGLFTATYAIDGSVKFKAKSISFANMPEDEFERLYQKTITVILQKVIPARKLSEQELRDWVDSVLSFAGGSHG